MNCSKMRVFGQTFIENPLKIVFGSSTAEYVLGYRKEVDKIRKDGQYTVRRQFISVFLVCLFPESRGNRQYPRIFTVLCSRLLDKPLNYATQAHRDIF